MVVTNCWEGRTPGPRLASRPGPTAAHAAAAHDSASTIPPGASTTIVATGWVYKRTRTSACRASPWSALATEMCVTVTGSASSISATVTGATNPATGERKVIASPAIWVDGRQKPLDNPGSRAFSLSFGGRDSQITAVLTGYGETSSGHRALIGVPEADCPLYDRPQQPVGACDRQSLEHELLICDRNAAHAFLMI